MNLIDTDPQSNRQLNNLPFDPQLSPGARNAVRVCLRVEPAEKVSVITDEASLEIAAALVRELEAVGCPYRSWVLEDVATRPPYGFSAGDRRRSRNQPGQHLRRAGAG